MATNEFQALVRRYTTLSDDLASSGKTMRELRQKARDLGESILAYMREENIDEARVDGGGKLVRRLSKRTLPLTKEIIADELRVHVSADRVPEVVEKILARRETTEVATLRRTKR